MCFPLDFFFFLIKCLTGFKLRREDALSVDFIWLKKRCRALCPAFWPGVLRSKNRSSYALVSGRCPDAEVTSQRRGGPRFFQLQRLETKGKLSVSHMVSALSELEKPHVAGKP